MFINTMYKVEFPLCINGMYRRGAESIAANVTKSLRKLCTILFCTYITPPTSIVCCVKADFYLNECRNAPIRPRLPEVGACVVGLDVDFPWAALGRIG